MSSARPAARQPLPPRWVPVGDGPHLCAAGERWDAVRVGEAVGRRAVAFLREAGEPVGPVVLDPEGPEPRMYFLVPVGTAALWEVQGTVPLGPRCHVLVPSAERTRPPGLHWHVVPAAPRSPTRPDALRQAIGRARKARAEEESRESRAARPGEVAS
ncbi:MULTISPECIES: hypothetical protein [Streptomyces]|uniref:hypothetical protein n=1 Tax=Streptomyces TaxID=1883 RepID=UPI00163CDE6B|nr:MULTISPECIES: hypothetical protein [Streptomyces]MBC2875278.1 hypothetical protein [Streptomyces sp. TYQ1024]UBI37102.1 hypothetical protein K7I03_11940 [Streptomyces mobaraensis]UKW29698.1 hypothetical protein MCU78_11915 [Streptomyces sp. TYQ1024]